MQQRGEKPGKTFIKVSGFTPKKYGMLYLETPFLKKSLAKNLTLKGRIT